MAERFKAAVERARSQRVAVRHNLDVPDSYHAEKTDTEAAWAALQTADLDARQLSDSRIITADRCDPAHVSFDGLKARLLRVLRKNGWRRVGILSPTRGCGATFVAANLALAPPQAQSDRTILVDMNLRAPSLSKVLGVEELAPAVSFLSGEAPANRFLQRVRPDLAVGVTRGRSRDAAEAMMDGRAERALKEMEARYQPDMILHDLPPLLSYGDAVGFIPSLDGVLLVVAGDGTRAESVSECERLLAGQTQLLGVLLNRAEPS